MQKISIIYLIDQMRNMGGAEKNLLNIISHINRARFNVHLYTFHLDSPMREVLEEKNIPCSQISYPTSIKGIFEFFTLARKIRKIKVNILHSYFEGADIWGTFLAKLAGIRVIISSKRDMGFTKNKKILTAYKIVNPFITKIISVSDAVKHQVNLQEKVNLDKIVTIYNGVDINKFRKSSHYKAFPSGLKLNSSSAIVGVLANIKPVKGLEYFIHAASRILQKFPSTQFIVVGGCLPNQESISYFKQLKLLVKNLRLDYNFFFLGERSDIAGVLSYFDISVLPSLSEGFSNTVIESMSAGKPLVVTDVGGNSEAVIHGKTGYVVPPGDINKLTDAISDLLQNRNLAIKMGNEGKKRAKALFSMDLMIDKIEKIYISTINRKYPSFV
jgi:glycosyltransferase involved in cell wall biosynthesis